MVLENTRYASNQTGVGEEWGEGECVAGGNTSILKMLQISTAFPRNHKHTFCLPAGLPPPHYTTRSCWVLHTVAWGGVGGPVTQLGRGHPCCLGKLPGASIVSPGQWVRICPRHPAAPWAPTRPDGHFEGVESSWLPTSCRAVWWEGGRSTLESRGVFGSSFCSVKYRGQYQRSLFFQLLALVWLGNSFLRPGSPLRLP